MGILYYEFHSQNICVSIFIYSYLITPYLKFVPGIYHPKRGRLKILWGTQVTITHYFPTSSFLELSFIQLPRKRSGKNRKCFFGNFLCNSINFPSHPINGWLTSWTKQYVLDFLRRLLAMCAFVISFNI